jgi:hypothetical protein
VARVIGYVVGSDFNVMLTLAAGASTGTQVIKTAQGTRSRIVVTSFGFAASATAAPGGIIDMVASLDFAAAAQVSFRIAFAGIGALNSNVPWPDDVPLMAPLNTALNLANTSVPANVNANFWCTGYVITS